MWNKSKIHYLQLEGILGLRRSSRVAVLEFHVWRQSAPGGGAKQSVEVRSGVWRRRLEAEFLDYKLFYTYEYFFIQKLAESLVVQGWNFSHRR